MTMKHWSTNVNQVVVQRGSNGSFNLCIEGGSEYGQFVVIGDVLTDKVIYKSGSLSPGEIILQINGVHVAGYTQTDGITLIRDSPASLNITSVLPGLGITRDLRKYLGTRFQRGSVDHELQQTIRDNLYMRTVPCTTRKPRPGEVPGVDYEFLTVNEYLELEKSGKLLESGFYESNYYGTPKPPKTPMTPGTGTIRRPKAKKKEVKKEDFGPLPNNWEVAYTRDGEQYFVDHNTGRTQWDDPRKMTKALSTSRLPTNANNIKNEEDDLPPGWEKVNDPKYGTYYIDHINRRTQYEKPEAYHQMRKFSSSGSRSVSNEPQRDREDTQSRKSLTIDARKLEGDTFRVSMRKGAKGFGFTIVGGENPGELLQVNNIVRGGTADTDGRLRTGDVIMRLNGRSVMSWSHGDIIRFLQQTRVGEIVELDLLRGYPLPFDSTDPAIKKVGSYSKSVNGDDLKRTASSTSLGSRHNTGYNSDGESIRRDGNNRLGAATPVAFRSGVPQYAVIPVVRGPNGFGFTIADSRYGQRVKEIIDRNRCQGLSEGDVIIRINSTVVHNLDHAEVVEKLKACPKGQATNFQVQRSGVLTVVKDMPAAMAKRNHPPRPKSMPNFDEQLQFQQQQQLQQGPMKTGVRSSSSMGVIATNGETSNDTNTTTYEERSHPQVSEAGDGYKSLKRAVQSHSRDTDGSAVSGVGFTDHVITLNRGAGGFGFRIIGGQEEKTQVAIDTIVPNGEAQKDGRLVKGDIILAVDGTNVVDASHKHVITLMQKAGSKGKVTLRVRRQDGANETKPVSKDVPLSNLTNNNLRERRKSDTESINSDKQVAEWIEDTQRARTNKPYREQADRKQQADSLRSKSESSISTQGRPKSCPPPIAPKPPAMSSKEVVLNRNANEGFGFVIMSSPVSKGSVIGRIIPESPADRCGELKVDDRLLSVNGHDVSNMNHSEIVSMVKRSGLEVTLTIEGPVKKLINANNQEDTVSPPPPRPVEPRNYTPSFNSYNRTTDTALIEEYRKQRKSIEEQRTQEIRDREDSQPPRPKSVPLNGLSNGHNSNNSSPNVTRFGTHEPKRLTMTNEDRDDFVDHAKQQRAIAAGDTVSVTLRKGERGFGFSIRGGEGMPLFVLRIAERGPAWEDGRIKVGDEILSIDDKNAEAMSHAQAVNTIRDCNDTVTLLIRRPLKPLVTEEERIPNGNYNRQRNAGYERPKSGYY